MCAIFHVFSEFLDELAPTLAYFPTDEDMTGAATALLRLQDTYALPTEKLARGEIQGVSYSQSLSGMSRVNIYEEAREV